MKRACMMVAICAAIGLSGCTESDRARSEATFSDRPADITCWSHGTQTFSGRSTGKVKTGDGGRIAFVDAATNRFTTVSGDCLVAYVASAK